MAGAVEQHEQRAPTPLEQAGTVVVGLVEKRCENAVERVRNASQGLFWVSCATSGAYTLRRVRSCDVVATLETDRRQGCGRLSDHRSRRDAP